MEPIGSQEWSNSRMIVRKRTSICEKSLYRGSFFFRVFIVSRKNVYQQNKIKKNTQKHTFLRFFLRALAYVRKKQYLCIGFQKVVFDISAHESSGSTQGGSNCPRLGVGWFSLPCVNLPRLGLVGCCSCFVFVILTKKRLQRAVNHIL